MDTDVTIESLLNLKGHTIWSVTPTATVFEAVQQMAEHNIGSLLVMEGDLLVGIISERDYARKIVLHGKNSRSTPVSEILTPVVHRISSRATIGECMMLMTDKRIRHLPVVGADGSIVGVFSARDALPREIDAAMTMAQFHEQINDALGGG